MARVPRHDCPSDNLNFPKTGRDSESFRNLWEVSVDWNEAS